MRLIFLIVEYGFNVILLFLISFKISVYIWTLLKFGIIIKQSVSNEKSLALMFIVHAVLHNASVVEKFKMSCIIKFGVRGEGWGVGCAFEAYVMMTSLWIA